MDGSEACAVVEVVDGERCPDGILAIHRGQDSFVSFAAHRDGEFVPLWNILVAKLREVYPRVASQLGRDAYVSINGYYRHAGQGRDDPDLHRPYRQRGGLRYLNAAYADLDGYRVGLSDGQLVGRLVELQDAGHIPPASIIARSGRGVWAFWLLVDPSDRSLPQRAFPEALDEYDRVQRAIHDRVAHLGADARDAVRVTRVPGSVNGKVNARVSYWLQADASGRVPEYTLSALAGSLGLEPRRPSRRGRTDGDPADDEVRRRKLRGFRGQVAKRLAFFEGLREMRGGAFAEGCRNRACVLYAHLLARAGTPPPQVVRRVECLGRECVPPLSESAIRDAIASGVGMKCGHSTIRNRTIAEWLLVTPSEAEALGWCEREVAATRDDIREARHLAIRHLLAETPGAMPSSRDIAGRLKDLGHDVSHVTVQADLRRMGVFGPPAPN